MSLVLGDHGAHTHHTHDQKNDEENDGNHEDWHTPPQQHCGAVTNTPSVTLITQRREAGQLLARIAAAFPWRYSAASCPSKSASERRSSSE